MHIILISTIHFPAGLNRGGSCMMRSKLNLFGDQGWGSKCDLFTDQWRHQLWSHEDPDRQTYKQTWLKTITLHQLCLMFFSTVICARIVTQRMIIVFFSDFVFEIRLIRPDFSFNKRKNPVLELTTYWFSVKSHNLYTNWADCEWETQKSFQ